MNTQRGRPLLPNNSVALLLNPDPSNNANTKVPKDDIQRDDYVSGSSTIYEKSTSAETLVVPKLPSSNQMIQLSIKKTDRTKNRDSQPKAPSDKTQNPHVYSQHKTKSNTPFVASQIYCETVLDRGKVVSEGTIGGIKYTVKEGSIPTIIVDEENLAMFPSPYELYRIFEPLGKQFGAIKVDFSNCKNTSLTSFSLDTENFWFKPRKQHTNSYTTDLKRRLKLHNELFKFHKYKKDKKGNLKLGKIPSIDKRTLDLHRLRACVQFRGGFDVVCEKKLWAQIGRELGYSGRIMSSLSTSLRSAYLKVFSEFDAYEKELESIHTKKDDLLIDKNDFYRTAKRQFSEAERQSYQDNTSNKRSCIKTPKANTEFGGSGKEYFRLRDILDSKGFETRFKSVTEPKAGITEPNSSTFPTYNFNMWNSHMEIYDKSMYEWRNSPIYNLRQYYDKAQQHQEHVRAVLCSSFPFLSSTRSEIDKNDFEQLYFTVVQDTSQAYDIDTALDLPCQIHGSGFSRSNSELLEIAMGTLRSWNLKEVNLHKESLFQHLDVDYGNLTQSTIDVGMLFSTSGWALEDEFLPLLDYSHLGSSKLWYFVPPTYRDSMEDFFRSRRNDEGLDVEKNYDEEFLKSDFFQRFQDTNFLDQNKLTRKQIHTHPLLKKVVDKKIEALPPNDIQIPLAELSARGIRSFSTIQDPKSFIIKYPQTYSTSICSGFQVSEKTLFAPKEWVHNLPEAVSWKKSRCELPCIFPFQFYVNIMENSTDDKLLEYLKPQLSKMVYTELENRKHIPANIRRVPNRFDPISDLDFSPTGASKVVIADEDDCISLSLSQYLSLQDRIKEIPNVSVELHEYYSQAFLKELTTILDNYAAIQLTGPAVPTNSPSVITKIEELKKKCSDGSKISFKHLKRLFLNAKNDNTGYYDALKSYVEKAQVISEKCQSILERLSVTESANFDHIMNFPMKILQPPVYDVSIDEINVILKNVNELAVTFDSATALCQHISLFSRFQMEARANMYSTDLTAVTKVYQLGLNLGINSVYLKLYARKISQLQWMNIYNGLFNDRTGSNNRLVTKSNDYCLENLISFLHLGIDLFGDSKLDEFKKLVTEINNVQWVTKTVNNAVAEKAHRISVTNLQRLVETTATLHVRSGLDFQNSLNQLLETVNTVKAVISPMQEKLLVNECFQSQFFTAIEENILTDAVISRFNGSAGDTRLTHQQAIELLEPTLYSKHLKAMKSWQQEMLKILRNGKTPLIRVLDRLNQCWAADDVFGTTNRYCFCRQGDNGSVMVQCEICGEWFHKTCVNDGHWVLPEDDTNVFCCEICMHQPSQKTLNLPSLDQLRQLCLDSGKLKVVPDKETISTLFQIYALCMKNHRCVKQAAMNDSTSIEELKFYTRKIIGSGILMPDLTQEMEPRYRSQDLWRLQQLLNDNKRVVSGYPQPSDAIGRPSLTDATPNCHVTT